jgi:predicted alpha/beta-hydrolase family hydrolase
MAEMQRTGKRKPPNRELAAATDPWRLLIGGKSLGGRMASLIANARRVAGLVCLGYPFHPPGKPDRLCTEYLQILRTPTLICQGTRDTFGIPEEVAAYALAPAIRLAWIEDGGHSFKPRRQSGCTWEQNLDQAAHTVIDFVAGCNRDWN